MFNFFVMIIKFSTYSFFRWKRLLKSSMSRFEERFISNMVSKLVTLKINSCIDFGQILFCSINSLKVTVFNCYFAAILMQTNRKWTEKWYYLWLIYVDYDREFFLNKQNHNLVYRALSSIIMIDFNCIYLLLFYRWNPG